jgi:hypothetical protein
MKGLVFGLLALLAGTAQAADYIDSTVPGSVGFTPAFGPYSVTVQVLVADQAGTTGTQAMISVNGSVFRHSGSGRGGGYITVYSEDNPTSATLTAADGSQPVTFTATQRSLYGMTYNVWTPSGPVPVGTYTLSVTGEETCHNTHGTSCAEQRPFYVAATTTYQTLPITYWWTGSINSTYQDVLGVVLVPVAVPTYPPDTSGPQQVCDLYNSEIMVGLQNFFNAIVPGRIQIDDVTSTASNPAGQWVCRYHLTYQDLVKNPGVDVVADTPDGIVTVDSGPTPPVFPPPGD